VIAVGPGAPDKDGKLIPTNVQAGDRVLLPGWGGNPIKVGEEVNYCLFFVSVMSTDDGTPGVPPSQRLGNFGQDSGVKDMYMYRRERAQSYETVCAAPPKVGLYVKHLIIV